jgi:hypothetical protein
MRAQVLSSHIHIWHQEEHTFTARASAYNNESIISHKPEDFFHFFSILAKLAGIRSCGRPSGRTTVRPASSLRNKVTRPVPASSRGLLWIPRGLSKTSCSSVSTLGIEHIHLRYCARSAPWLSKTAGTRVSSSHSIHECGSSDSSRGLLWRPRGLSKTVGTRVRHSHSVRGAKVDTRNLTMKLMTAYVQYVQYQYVQYQYVQPTRFRCAVPTLYPPPHQVGSLLAKANLTMKFIRAPEIACHSITWTEILGFSLSHRLICMTRSGGTILDC